jgi:hypothetical protein
MSAAECLGKGNLILPFACGRLAMELEPLIFRSTLKIVFYGLY